MSESSKHRFRRSQRAAGGGIAAAAAVTNGLTRANRADRISGTLGATGPPPVTKGARMLVRGESASV